MKPSSRLLLLAFAAAVLATGTALAQPSCSGDETLMSWPDVNPVWQLCWIRPQDSSGPNGSGLEIRSVYYNGHQVLKRGHVPIVNVLYPEGGCGGCYRDWMFSEQGYLSNNVISAGYAEPTSPCPQTVCEIEATMGDCPSLTPPDTCPGAVCFTGVAAQKLPDRLIMTAQTSAGWYRYTHRWTFHLDGRIEPFFGYTAVNNPCLSLTHIHHAYWRLDFDIDGAPNDLVTEGPDPAAGGRTRGTAVPDRQPPDGSHAQDQPSEHHLGDRGRGHAPRLPARAGTGSRTFRPTRSPWATCGSCATRPTRSTTPASPDRPAPSSSTTSSTARVSRPTSSSGTARGRTTRAAISTTAIPPGRC